MVPEYRGHQERRGLSPRTIAKNTRCIRQFLEVVGGDLDAVTPDAVDAFLQTRNLSSRSRYWWLSAIHTFYRWAIRHGHATRDPTELIDRPRLAQTLPRPIATADLAFALESAPPLQRALVSLMAFEGLRCQEVAGIQREDVLDTMTPPMLFVTKGKGGKQRAVPLHDDTIASLRSLPMPRSGPLFDMQPWKVSQRVNRFLHGLGIDATAHQLRHWYATECYRDSHDLRMVQELLGHSSPSTTAIYTKLDMVAAAPVVQRLSASMARHPTALLGVAGGLQGEAHTVTDHRRSGDNRGATAGAGAGRGEPGGSGTTRARADGGAVAADRGVVDRAGGSDRGAPGDGMELAPDRRPARHSPEPGCTPAGPVTRRSPRHEGGGFRADGTTGV